MNRKNRIENVLSESLSPELFEVIDESHKHAGHAGARPEGETHYRVKIIAEAFAGKGRVQRHQTVNKLLAAEFESGLHALSLDLKAPQEVQG